MSGHKITDEEMKRLAVAMIPYAKKLAEYARANLPEGVHWMVAVLPPGVGGVIAISSDRDVMAPNVASWVMETLRPRLPRDHPNFVDLGDDVEPREERRKGPPERRNAADPDRISGDRRAR